MDDAPVVLGINRTQDASICLMHGSQLVWAIQKERLTRQKHHWGKPGDVSRHCLPALPGLERSIDVLVECFSSDAEIDALPEYEAELANTLSLLDLLCARKAVGLYQGGSEFGPRALGHRSILGDPRRGYMRDWINAPVKQRECFRPLAPVVLEEQAQAWFDVPGPSPFMQFAAPVRPERASTVPAITHVDGTARLQTVAADGDPLLRALLLGFAERTGVPILLNTSFNGKDEPIIETPAQALASFRRMPLHALAMPPYLLRKRVAPELPE